MVCKKVEIRNIALELVKELKESIAVDRVVLFGSYAYGNPNTTSDIDFAVVSQEFGKMNDIRRIMLLSHCARKLDSPPSVDIDVIGYTEEELEQSDYFELGGEIHEKGLTIYQAKVT
ncbi:MAG: nucleotidyltransferase domain-containing protein [Deltaproteobacteria bacterium]|nr:nucleotidyltransferase domain-containing protein [Deltaproteobacteria bacterium]